MSPIIWLVEDNEDDVALARHAIKKTQLDAALVVSRDGEEAIRFLSDLNKDHQNLPSLVLLDLRLPKINGLEVLSQIRNNPSTRRLPVAVLTTSDEENDILSSYSLGANSFVRKPVDFDVFVETMRQLGNYWLVLNTPPPK